MLLDGQIQNDELWQHSYGVSHWYLKLKRKYAQIVGTLYTNLQRHLYVHDGQCFLIIDHIHHEIIGLFHLFHLQSLEILSRHCLKQRKYLLQRQKFHQHQLIMLLVQLVKCVRDCPRFVGYNGDTKLILVIHRNNPKFLHPLKTILPVQTRQWLH